MITVGFAATGVTVHSARIETRGGVAIDRFEITDTEGRKLDRAREHDARRTIWDGAGPPDARLARFRRRWLKPSGADAASAR